MFRNHLAGELCMFGAVAITFLAIDTISAGVLSYDVHVMFKFVDVFCSVGACLLIVIGVW